MNRCILFIVLGFVLTGSAAGQDEAEEYAVISVPEEVIKVRIERDPFRSIIIYQGSVLETGKTSECEFSLAFLISEHHIKEDSTIYVLASFVQL